MIYSYFNIKCVSADGQDCSNTDNGAQGNYGVTCEWYDRFNYYPELRKYCGKHDNDNFKAKQMCCACKKWPFPGKL